MKLYSAWYCPFAQRAWMAVLYKKIDFKYIEIDPYEKTAQWLAISKGTGQVPVVIYSDASKQEVTIVDSSAIVAFLDQNNPKKLPLFSNNPAQVKKQELWVEHINKKIIPYFYRYLKANVAGTERDEARSEMIKGITEFAQEMLNAKERDGSYFCDDKLNAVDISFIPFAYRIDLLLGHYRDFTLPKTGDIWERYHQWYEAVVKHHTFKETGVNREGYKDRLIEFYLPYSLGDGQKDVTDL